MTSNLHLKFMTSVFIGMLLISAVQPLEDYYCMYQSQVEIKHYSIVYFDCITAFEAL